MGSSGHLLCPIPSMGSSGAIRSMGCSVRHFCPIRCMGSLDGKVPAAILSIGTANPPAYINQDDYPDFLFRVTNSEHLTHVKRSFTHLCNRSGMKKRHFVMTEEIFQENPCISSSGAASFNRRQDLATKVHPELAMAAATKAIDEWGQPKSTITHLIMCSSSGVDMPGSDAMLVQLLGLSPSVNRLMLYSLGCYASGTVLRISKDIAENNPEARILAVSVETTVLLFQAPSVDDPASLIPSSTFGDGAAAMVIGTVPPDTAAERPLFQIISASQMLVPGTVGALTAEYWEHGFVINQAKEVPQLISSNLKACLAKTFSSATNSDAVEDWNSIFWAVHLGYTQVFDRVEKTLGLSKEKLRASRHVREEYGNMLSATVMFILDELRNKSMKEGMTTTGEGLEWGVLLGFGPGITIETVVLRSVPLQAVAKSRPFLG